MAVQTNPEGVQIRGKAGGTVYQTWRGRQVRRSLSRPTNPRSARQLDVRGDMQLVMNGVKHTFAISPSTKEDWQAWSVANPWPTTKRMSGGIVLPAFQSAMKVGMAAYSAGLYSPTSSLPTTNPQRFEDSHLVVTADDNTLKIASIGAGATFAATNAQIWVCAPVSPGNSPKPQQARLVYIQDNLDAAIVAHVFYTAPLDFGVEQTVCVWGRVMQPSDSKPSAYSFIGTYTLVGA